MDYLLTQEEIYNTIHKIPMSKYAIILKSTKNEYQYNHQVKIMERHALLEAQLEKVQGMIADMEAECEARLKEQSVIHSMEIEQVKKETAQEIFSEIEDRFAEWNGEKYINNLVIVEYGSDHDWQALKSKYGIEG
jgi:hypothetical protein